MHEKDRKYNGWSNYETWNFKLWLDNDEDTYNRIKDLLRIARRTLGRWLII